MPSETEWYKAAYYDPIAGLYYDYPTGTNATIGCVVPGGDTGNSANCESAASGLTNVGAYVLSDSPSGTYDQGGNVIEWNELIYFGAHRGTRGGAYYLNPPYLAVGSTCGGNPTNEDAGVGFRVASIPEPSTALLVLIGLLGLAARRRGCA